MANNLFKDIDLRNKPSRSAFDLSHTHFFTAKCGELLPVFHKTVMPGDKFICKVNSFTRTAPLQTAAFTRFKQYYDWFFVPYRLLGKQIPDILASNTKNPPTASSSTTNQPVASKLPYTTLWDLYGTDGISNQYVYTLSHFVNEFGFDRGYLSAKLLSMLGYCKITNEDYEALSSATRVPYRQNLEVTLLPLMSYNKIYYDFYRNKQWEDNVPYNYNVDYMGSDMKFHVDQRVSGSDLFNPYYYNPTMFDLRYANYPKDLFMGLLPESQYGDEAVVELDAELLGSPTQNVYALDTRGGTSTTVKVGDFVEDPDGNPSSTIKGYSGTITSDLSLTPDSLLKVNIPRDLKGSFSVLTERRAKALQRYKEILGTGSLDYKNIISKIFGVNVPDTLSNNVIYLGGSVVNVNINEVENTNLSEGNQADIKGKGIGSSNTDTINFESDEFGCIMCIYHVAPDIEYSLTGINFDVTKTDVDDYANPVFDNLGLVELPTYYLTNGRIFLPSGSIPDDFLGYTTRYFDYKTCIDHTSGDFNNTLKDWISPVDDEYLLKRPDAVAPYRIRLDYTFFKINPKIVDRIFGVIANDNVNTDQFRVEANFDIKAVRNLNYLGVPY